HLGIFLQEQRAHQTCLGLFGSRYYKGGKFPRTSAEGQARRTWRQYDPQLWATTGYACCHPASAPIPCAVAEAYSRVRHSPSWKSSHLSTALRNKANVCCGDRDRHVRLLKPQAVCLQE